MKPVGIADLLNILEQENRYDWALRERTGIFAVDFGPEAPEKAWDPQKSGT